MKLWKQVEVVFVLSMTWTALAGSPNASACLPIKEPRTREGAVWGQGGGASLETRMLSLAESPALSSPYSDSTVPQN